MHFHKDKHRFRKSEQQRFHRSHYTLPPHSSGALPGRGRRVCHLINHSNTIKTEQNPIVNLILIQGGLLFSGKSSPVSKNIVLTNQVIYEKLPTFLICLHLRFPFK